jgi:hypothetical protein
MRVHIFRKNRTFRGLRFPPGFGCIPVFLCLLCAQAEIRAQPSGHAGSFAYVGKDYVITAELAVEHSFVVNFINLSDFVTVVQPGDFIYRSVSGLCAGRINTFSVFLFSIRAEMVSDKR